jgi:AraC family transcriptional regulator
VREILKNLKICSHFSGRFFLTPIHKSGPPDFARETFFGRSRLELALQEFFGRMCPVVKTECLSSGHHGKISEIKNLAGFKFVETRYAAGFNIPRHFHEHACICVVISGSFHEDFTRRKLQLDPKSVAFRPAGEVHLDHFGNAGAHCLVAEMPANWMNHVRQHGDPFDEPLGFQRGQLPWLGARIYRECKRSDEFSPLVIEGIMLEIAGELSRCSTAVEHAVPRWLERVRDAVQSQYARGLHLQDLAAEAGVHPVHLAREFRRRYGCSVGEYIRHLRIDAACQRLTHSDASIAEIALDIGFSSQAHFSRTFRVVTGVPPLQYRLRRR